MNGVSWTFVTGTPSGNQTQIGADIDATLGALASDLNASADAQISKCTYTADDRLEIEFDTAGTSGNSFTLAASATSNVTVSAPILTGGGYIAFGCSARRAYACCPTSHRRRMMFRRCANV